MRALLVARTAGPMKNLARIAQALSDRNHEVMAVFSQDPGLMVNVHALMGINPNVVLATTSSMNINDELAVILRAKEREIPYAVFADTYGAHNRPEMLRDLKECCAAVFVPDAPEAKFARFLNYPRVEVVGVPLWEDFADLSNFPPRKKTREELGIAEDEVAAISAFGKDYKVNCELFAGTLRALGNMVKKTSHKFVFLPRFHPGDQQRKQNQSCYKSILDNSPVRVVYSEKYKSSDDLVPATDLVISQFSTVAITAIYQRKRVIEYALPAVLDRLENQTGRRAWPTHESGAAQIAENSQQLEWLIGRLLDDVHDDCWALQRKAQEENYPITKGGAAKKIVAVLEEIAAT